MRRGHLARQHRCEGVCQNQRAAVRPALHLAGYYRADLHARIASRSGVISIIGHARGEKGIGLARIRKNDEYAARISRSC